MQIAITKKIADALGLDVPEAKQIDPMCGWIANWTNIWANRKTNNMLILVHQKTKFPVAIYQVKKKELKNIRQLIPTAIKNTMRELSFNPELIDRYLEHCGEIEFVRLRDRTHVSWVNRAGMQCAVHAIHRFEGRQSVFNDYFAHVNARFGTKHPETNDHIYPCEVMAQELERMFDQPVYDFPALELTITLDYDDYPIRRRIIVPADMKLSRFHKVLQRLFGWKDAHLHDFQLTNDEGELLRLVPYPEDVEWDESAVLITDQRLSDFFPAYRQMNYAYDFGVYWNHLIELVREIDHYHQETPYVLEAIGNAPPEDIGGSISYDDYLAICRDPKHPDHEIYNHWSLYWNPELSEHQKRPHVLYL